jgi:hypothetical protein
VRHVAEAHDFTWSDEQIEDMVGMFDGNHDGLVSLCFQLYPGSISFWYWGTPYSSLALVSVLFCFICCPVRFESPWPCGLGALNPFCPRN